VVSTTYSIRSLGRSSESLSSCPISFADDGSGIPGFRDYDADSAPIVNELPTAVEEYVANVLGTVKSDISTDRAAEVD